MRRRCRAIFRAFPATGALTFSQPAHPPVDRVSESGRTRASAGFLLPLRCCTRIDMSFVKRSSTTHTHGACEPVDIGRRQLLAGVGLGAAAIFFEDGSVSAQAPQRPSIVFAHTVLVTVDGVMDDVALAVEGDRIAAIGPSDSIVAKYPNAEAYDGRGKALVPGLINCHAHLAATLERGFNEDFGFPNSARLAIRPASLLRGEEGTLMVSVGALEAIRTGTTTIVENSGGINRVAAALAQTGLRCVFAESVRDSEN